MFREYKKKKEERFEESFCVNTAKNHFHERKMQNRFIQFTTYRNYSTYCARK